MVNLSGVTAVNIDVTWQCSLGLYFSIPRLLSYIMSVFLFFSFFVDGCMRLLYNQHGIGMNRIAFHLFSGFINFLFLRLLLPRLL